jgi:outer membrane protein assembly factor BamB
MTVIELGEVTHEAAPALAAPVDLRRAVRVVLAVVALAGSLVLAGSARPAPPTVHPLWTTPQFETDVAVLHDDTAYLSHRTRLTAHDTATGKVRWTAQIGNVVPGVSVTAGLVLLGLDPVEMTWVDSDGFTYSNPYNRATLALDAATGAERWRLAGDLGPGGTDGTSMMFESVGSGVLTRLRRVRLSDGRDLWSRPAPGVVTWTMTWNGVEPDLVVTLTETGEVSVLRYADGTLVHQGRLPGRGRDFWMSGAGSDLLVTRTNGPSISTVYRPADLSEKWHVAARIDYLADCGPLLCSLDDRGVAGRDPATGREVWRQGEMHGVADAGPGHVLLFDGSPGGIMQLVDAATGRQLGGLRYGTPASAPRAAPMVITRRATASPGRQLVLRLDPATGVQTLLGTTQLADDHPCWATDRYLGCSDGEKFTVSALG